MQAHGYRPTNRTGAHQAVGLYGAAAFAGNANESDVKAFDRMRQIRNRSEYNQQPITERLLSTDLAHAKAIVAAVEAALPLRSQSELI